MPWRWQGKGNVGDGSSGWCKRGEESTRVLRAGRAGALPGCAVPANRAAKLPMGLHWPATRGAVNGDGSDFGWKAASAEREVSTVPTCWWGAGLSCCLSPAAGWEGALAWRPGAGTPGSADTLGLAPSPCASSATLKHGQQHPGARLSGSQPALVHRGQLLHTLPRGC